MKKDRKEGEHPPLAEERDTTTSIEPVRLLRRMFVSVALTGVARENHYVHIVSKVYGDESVVMSVPQPKSQG